MKKLIGLFVFAVLLISSRVISMNEGNRIGLEGNNKLYENKLKRRASENLSPLIHLKKNNLKKYPSLSKIENEKLNEKGSEKSMNIYNKQQKNYAPVLKQIKEKQKKSE